jgi:hypothetical protein
LKDLRFKTFGIFGEKTVIKAAKVDRVDAVIDEIAQRILVELEGATSADLSDVLYAKKILHLADIQYARTVLQQIGTKGGGGSDSEIEKRAVIKVLLFSTWLQRLYFIIRSSIMGLIGSIVTFLFIWSLGTINAVTSYIFGLLVFALSLVITRFFDVQLTQATKKIVELMACHRASRDFIMSHF